MTQANEPTAALLIIGDEILSGRTQDSHLVTLAQRLGPLGIRVAEVRIVSDETADIVAAVNALKARYTYVFTTGGIGPTHDDITADAIAAAFGVPISHHPEVMALLAAHYPPGQFNEARQRMARIPQGASLIDNPVSKAPGFRIGNVFVLAGVPRVMVAMLESVVPSLTGGAPLQSRTIGVYAPEGAIAEGLGIVARDNPDVSIGSYPFYTKERFGANLVVRSGNLQALEAAVAQVKQMLRSSGFEAHEGELR
ncbi:MAG: competence/damage-inducible protein A [Alphaproteobacteria bacterium]|nr:competence/damage-inducible protein A [Alphaproteobacteria bacterium]